MLSADYLLEISSKSKITSADLGRICVEWPTWNPLHWSAYEWLLIQLVTNAKTLVKLSTENLYYRPVWIKVTLLTQLTQLEIFIQFNPVTSRADSIGLNKVFFWADWLCVSPWADSTDQEIPVSPPRAHVVTRSLEWPVTLLFKPA